MSVPHRIGACFCILGQENAPKNKRDPVHRFNPSSKADADKGLANEGDETPAREGYGGGANSYFAAYPTYLITKAKGTNLGSATAAQLPAIEITLQPYRNFWSCNVIDERTEITGYLAADALNLTDPTDLYNNTAGAGKGEFITQNWTVFFDDVPPAYCDTTEEELVTDPKTIIRPLDSQENDTVYFDDLKFYPTEEFAPWRHNYLQGSITQGAILCSMSAYNIHCDMLGVNAYGWDGPFFNYARLMWQPQAQNADGLFYSNTSTWQLKVKADLCCWNKGFKIKGRVKISKIELERRPRFPAFPNYPYYNTTPDNFYQWEWFWGDIFKVVEGAEPQPYQEVPWEVLIDETTADGTLKVAADIQIPQENQGSIKELYFINGFVVDDIEPPLPPQPGG